MDKTALNLQERVLALIARGVDQPTSDSEFDELALAIFEFQFERNTTYRAYCEHLKRTPQSVERWKDIPAVPASAFKHFALTCFPVEEATAEFQTSGTTADKAGRHFMRTTALYDAAIIPNFAAHLLPDSARPHMLVLTPSPDEAAHSSLAHMMSVVVKKFGAAGSGFFVERGSLSVKRLVPELRAAERPVMLLGTALAFVHLFEDRNLRLELPEGSRAMETGGFKGRSREMTKRELYSLFKSRLGIPEFRVVNEYGMTELSTQFYDDTLRVGRQSDRKSAPPWARVLVMNPNTGREAEMNERGLIRVIDLANLWSTMCVQTEDLCISHGEYFEILGRAAGAEVRGCSLNAESISLR
jgi:hypothetical protein